GLRRQQREREQRLRRRQQRAQRLDTPRIALAEPGEERTPVEGARFARRDGTLGRCEARMDPVDDDGTEVVVCLAQTPREEEGVGIALLARRGHQYEDGLGPAQERLHLEGALAKPGEERREGREELRHVA